MGVCNGFQILVESGLLPGVLLRNKYLEFICKNIFVKINDKNNHYFKNIKKDILKLHIAHNEGNYFCNQEQIKEIDDNNQVALFYSDVNGNVNDESNPNGSMKNIAGIFNKEKNILGMMPHPERMIAPALSGEDGSIFFENLINNLNNPNGSMKNIAGIFNKEKNILGMMPHPERMIDPALSGEDGSIFFDNLINNLK